MLYLAAELMPDLARSICGRGYSGSGMLSAVTSDAHLDGMSAPPEGDPHLDRDQDETAGRRISTICPSALETTRHESVVKIKPLCIV